MIMKKNGIGIVSLIIINQNMMQYMMIFEYHIKVRYPYK